MREMKESEIAWVGTVPANWEVKRGKYVLRLLSRPTKESDEVITCFRDGEVTLRKNRRDEGFTVSFKEIGYQGVEPGDLVIHGMDGFAGSIGISDSRGKSSPVLVVCDSDENKRYIMYYLRSMAYNDVFSALATGIRVRSCDLRWNKLAELPYILPDIREQGKIVCAIESCTAKVDALIANVQAQIEKLKAYKQSLITETVTKGLDPAVPMKDSGVEWIGEIPEHWEVRRIKHIADPNIENSYIDGDWIESPFITDNGIRYYTTGNVGDGAFKHQGNGYISEETFAELNCKYAYPGDLVISRLNEPYGRSCILPNDVERCIIAVDVVILRPSVEFNKQYLCYQTQMPNYHAAVGEKARGTAMKRISRFNLGNIFLIVPPKHEQDTMAHLLDEKCRRVDQLITIKQKKIDKLNEYKKSLIYEYVTGKKEVS